MTDRPRYLSPDVRPSVLYNLNRAVFVLRGGSKARETVVQTRVWLINQGRRDDVSVAALGAKILTAMAAISSTRGEGFEVVRETDSVAVLTRPRREGRDLGLAIGAAAGFTVGRRVGHRDTGAGLLRLYINRRILGRAS